MWLWIVEVVFWPTRETSSSGCDETASEEKIGDVSTPLSPCSQIDASGQLRCRFPGFCPREHGLPLFPATLAPPHIPIPTAATTARSANAILAGDHRSASPAAPHVAGPGTGRRRRQESDGDHQAREGTNSRVGRGAKASRPVDHMTINRGLAARCSRSRDDALDL